MTGSSASTRLVHALRRVAAGCLALGLALCLPCATAPAAAASAATASAAAASAAATSAAPRHALWALHGRHNTVYLLGSIHILRSTDHPLPQALLRAYGDAGALIMELALDDLDLAQVRRDMLAAALLPADRSLPGLMGAERYARARTLAQGVGVQLSTLDRFAPWFAAEAIAQQQLQRMGFSAQSGVELYFLELARRDGKPVSGLESVDDQIALFKGLSPDAQADYLMASLAEAHDLPGEVDAMVRAWRRGDSAWFEHQMNEEFGQDPALYDAFLIARNRRWVPQIEALLRGDQNYLVIVGTGHLVGHDSLLALLQQDGFGATQQ